MPLRTEISQGAPLPTRTQTYAPASPVKTESKTSISHLFDDFGKVETSPEVEDLFYDFQHKHDKTTTKTAPVISDTAETETKTKRKAKSSAFGAVWRTVASQVVNFIRQNLTPGLKTDEEVAQMQSASAENVDNLSNSLVGKFLVSTAKQNSQRAGTTALAKVAEATGAPETIKSTYKAAWTSGTKMKAVEDRLAGKADLANQTGLTRFTANVFGSMPTSIMTRVPVLGYVLMGNQSFKNSLEDTIEQMALTGEKYDNSTILLKAFGNAGIDIGTEMLGGQFGKLIGGKAAGSLTNSTKGLLDILFKKSAKEVLSEAGQSSIKALAKGILKTANEEGMEEVLASIGSGILAKVTTDKDLEWLSWKNDGTAAISILGIIDAYATGAVAAGLQNVPSGIATFNNIRKASATLDKPISEITVADYEAYIDAVKKDMKFPSNQKAVLQTVANTIESQYTEDQLTTMAENGMDYINTNEEQAQESSVKTANDLFADFEGEVEPEATNAPAMPAEAPQTVVEGVAPVSTSNVTTEQASIVQPAVAPVVEDTKSQMPKVKKGDYVNIEGQGIGIIENIYDDGAFNVDINGQTYHRSADDIDYSKTTASEYWTDLKRQINELKAVATKSRKKASDYNKSTDGVAVARKGKIALSEDGRPMPFVENAISATHRTMITDAKKASGLADALQKKLDARKARLERELGYGIKPDASEAKALGVKVPESGNIPAKSAKTSQKQATKTAITKESISEKISKGEDVTEDVKEWLETDEGKEAVAGVETADDIFKKLSETIEKINDGKKDLNLPDNFLQLLSYKTIAEKLKIAGEVKGHDINQFTGKMLVALKESIDSKDYQKLINKFRIDDLIHAVYGNKEALDKVDERVKKAEQKTNGLFKDAMDLSLKLQQGHKMATKDDLLYLVEAVKKMSEAIGTDAYARDNVDRLIKRIGKIGTKAGQLVQAFSVIKNIVPEYLAQNITKSYEDTVLKTVSKEKLNERDTLSDKTADVVNKARKDVGQKLGETFAGYVEKAKKARKEGKQAKVELDPASLFANRIMRRLEKKEPKARIEIEQTIKNLYQKFIEVADLPARIKERQNMYEVLAEVILNRDKYKQYWQQAREILNLNETMNKGEGMNLENYTESQKFFTEITESDFIKKIINRTVIDTIADANISIADLAKRYFLAGDSTISGFADAIKAELAKAGITMDEVSYKRMEDYLIAEFKTLMVGTQKLAFERLVKQNEKISNKPEFATEQAYVIDQITKAAYMDVFDDSVDTIKNIWSKRLGIPVMTPEIKNLIYKAAKDMAQTDMAKDDKGKLLPQNEREALRNAIYDKMVVEVSNTIPSTNIEKIQAWLRTAMLFNPTTILRNMISNIVVSPYYSATDKLASKMIHGLKGIPADAQIAGKSVKKYSAKQQDDAAKAVASATTEDLMKREQARIAKYSLRQLFGMEKRVFNTKWLQNISTFTYKTMSYGLDLGKVHIKAFGDIYKFTQWYQQSMYNKLLAQGYSESMTAEQKDQIIENAKEYAVLQATTRTFRNMTLLSETLKNLQNSMLQSEKPGAKVAYLALKSVTPFVITPAAIVSETYKFSPLALAKVLLVDIGVASVKSKVTGKSVDASKKVATAQKLSQALVGTTFQFATGMILSAFGFLTGKAPEDEDERKQWEAIGRKPYSIYIPGVGYFPIDWLQPVSTGIMIGAETYQRMIDPDTSALERFVSPFTTSVDVAINNSLVQNFFQLFGGDYQQATATGTVSKITQNLFLQGVPALVKKLNKVIDPYERNTYSGTAIQVFINRVLEGIPGGTYAISKKIDVWGNEIKRADVGGLGVFGRFINNLVLPFAVSADKMDNVTKEVTRVFNETRDSAALPSVANKTITRTVKKIKYTWELTADEYIDYQQKIGQLSRAGVKKLIASSEYKQMTDAEKAKALGKVYSESVRSAGDAYVEKHPKR